MLRLSLSETLSLRVRLKRNQVLLNKQHSRGFLVSTSRTSLSLARLSTELIPSRMISAPLCSCSGAVPRCLGRRAQKTRRLPVAGRDILSNRPVRKSGVALAPRSCPFPVIDDGTRLLKRRLHSATCTIRHVRGPRQPAGLSAAASPPASAD